VIIFAHGYVGAASQSRAHGPLLASQECDGGEGDFIKWRGHIPLPPPRFLKVSARVGGTAGYEVHRTVADAFIDASIAGTVSTAVLSSTLTLLSSTLTLLSFDLQQGKTASIRFEDILFPSFLFVTCTKPGGTCKMKEVCQYCEPA
jgi:hypothetical protein